MKAGIRILLFAVLSASSTFAVPQLINYQGSLTRPDGSPLDTTVTMTFKLWGAASAGTLYWTETDAAVAVTNGLFNVSLGQTTALADTILNHPQLWLGIIVGSDAEMTPRVQLKSVAYSYRVGTVDGASGGTITGDVKIVGKGNIGGGNSNSGYGAFVAGVGDTVSGDYATVSGGYANTASGVEYTTVGGGFRNTASSGQATVGGGYDNTASGAGATVAGGNSNMASGTYTTISGGLANTASGNRGTVGGGFLNTAGGDYSTVPGGLNCVANGDYSFVAGRNVKTNGNAIGTFVWGDNDANDTLVAQTPNRVIFRAANGYRLYTADDLSTGVSMGAGDGAWSSISDSTKKRNRRNVDTKAILDKVAAMPIQQWSYKSQDSGVEHIGPMAQDFYNAFHLGESDTTISTLDPDGVALAAIQELAKRNQRLEQEVAELKALVQSQTKYSLNK